MSKGLELLGGPVSDPGLLFSGGAISVDPTISVDSEDAPKTNGDGGKVHGNSCQQVAKAEHVRVCSPESAVSRDHAVDVGGEEAQSNDWVLPEGKDPSNQVDHGDRDPEEAHESDIQDVRVVISLGDFGEEPQETLQRVALLADTLVEHG